MKEKQPDKDLSRTHTYFFDQSIKKQTDKALLITVPNKKGAMSTVWVPKSKIAFEIMKRRAQEPPHEFVEIKKYFAPNHFIK